MKRLLILSSLFLVSVLSYSQTSTVSGVIQDPTTQVFANGTVTINFVPTPGSSGPYTVSGSPIQLNGSNYAGPVTLNLDGTGSFSTTMSRNDFIFPSKSTWQFTACPNASAACTTVNININSGIFNISSVINAQIPNIKVVAGSGIPRAYNQNEIIITPNAGQSYFDLTAGLLNFWNGSSWVSVVINGSNPIFATVTAKNYNLHRFASQFTATSSTDACIQSKDAIASIPSPGGVVTMDYEGVTPVPCTVNPFGALVGNTNKPGHIQMGAFTLQVTHQILIPQESSMIGIGRGACLPGVIINSCIKADPTFITQCSISGWSRSSNVVTVNTTSTCGLETGVQSIVRIAGAATGGSGGNINTLPSAPSQFLVTPVTATQFTYSLAGANESGASGGTVTVPLIVLGDVAASADSRLEHVGIEANSLANEITVYSNSINEHSGLIDVFINDATTHGVFLEHTNTAGPPSNWFIQDVEINLVGNTTNANCFQFLGAFNDQRGLDHFTCNGTSIANITSWSRTSNVVSLVTSPAMNMSIGQQINVANSTQGATTNINGVWVLTNVAGATVQFSQTAANDSASSGGTVDFAATGTTGFLLDGVSGLWSRLHSERVVDGVVIGSQTTTAQTWAPQVDNATCHPTVTNCVRLENTSTPSYVGLYGIVKEGGINILKDNINSTISTQVAIGQYTIGLTGQGVVLTTDQTIASELPGQLTVGQLISGNIFIATDNIGAGAIYNETIASGAAAGKDACYGDSTAHVLECSYNNSAFSPVIRTLDLLTPPPIGTTTPAAGSFTTLKGTTYNTTTNCAVNSVSPAACGSAPAGAFVIPTTTTTYTVNTTAVTANSVIFLTPRTYTGNLPSSPTCVVPAITAEPVVSAISAGTSFTITEASTTGQTCWNYHIVN